MQFLWSNLHFSVSIYPYPRLIDIIFPEETKTETQSAYLKRTPDKIESVSLENTKAVPFNKGVGVVRSCFLSTFLDGLQCLSVLQIWVIVGQGPTVLAADVGWGWAFFFNYEDMFIISHLTYLPFLMPHRLS